MIGEPRIPCARVVPPIVSGWTAPAFVAAMAVELSRRHPPPDDRWAARLWAHVAPEFAGATGVRPGPAGSIIVAWSLERSDAVAMVAEIALALPRRLSRAIRETVAICGGIALDGVDVRGPATTRSSETSHCSGAAAGASRSAHRSRPGPRGRSACSTAPR
jgi:hypothetical protein